MIAFLIGMGVALLILSVLVFRSRKKAYWSRGKPMSEVTALRLRWFAVTFFFLMGIFFTFLGVTIQFKTEWCRAIVENVRPLVEVAKAQEVTETAISIRGSPLVWDMTTDSGWVGTLPLIKRPQCITLFIITAKHDFQTGTYSISGQPGYRQVADIVVIYWPEKEIVGMRAVGGEFPPEFRPVEQRPEYGNLDKGVAEWVDSLPMSTCR